jgi:hypothetical protein
MPLRDANSSSGSGTGNADSLVIVQRFPHQRDRTVTVTPSSVPRIPGEAARHASSGRA